jgi:hypothetical protein
LPLITKLIFPVPSKKQNNSSKEQEQMPISNNVKVMRINAYIFSPHFTLNETNPKFVNYCVSIQFSEISRFGTLI